jgi:hypothetical protein
MCAHDGADGNIFVNLWPMHADAFSDESPVAALIRRGISQSWKPFQRCGNFAAIRQGEMKSSIVYVDIDGVRVELNR